MALDAPKPDLRRPKGLSLLASARSKAIGAAGTCDLRDYAPGDDYRQIDWTWCARRDEVLTKVRPPHAETHLFLLIDCSRSMELSSTWKLDLARRLAAVLGADALRHEQAVSAAAFSDRINTLLPLRWGTTGIAALMQFLNDIHAQGADTYLAAAADGLARTTRRRGAVVLISDLLDRHGFARGIDRLLHHGFDPFVVQPIDPAGANPPCLGEVELLDVETGQTRRVTITERAAAEFRHRVGEFTNSVRVHCLQRRIICLQPECPAQAEEVARELSRAAANRLPRQKGRTS